MGWKVKRKPAETTLDETIEHQITSLQEMAVALEQSAPGFPGTVRFMTRAQRRRYAPAVADTVLLTASLVAASLPATWWHGRPWPLLVGSSFTIGLAGLAIACAPHMGGWRWNSAEPVCVAAAVERLGWPRRVFSNDTWLLYRFHPAVRLDFVWEYVAGPVHTAERLAAWDTGPAGMDGYLTRYRPDTVVLPHRYW